MSGITQEDLIKEYFLARPNIEVYTLECITK